MKAAHVNGIVLHYRVDGPEDAPLLVFANSLGTDFRIWDGVVAALGGQFRIVRYDKRGHGLSQVTPAPYSIADHAHDLAELLRHLQAGPAIVCGVSVGGMIAQMFASEHPASVRGLVLCNTAHKIGTAHMWESRIETIAANGIEVMADGIMERWFSAAFHNERADEMQLWRNMLTRTPLEGYLGTSAAIRDADLGDLVQKIAAPALCVAGSEDLATPPDHVEELSKLLPHARFRLIEGVGHLPCVERPDELVDRMIPFFNEAKLV